jgi:hypothetical protein
MPSVQHRFYSYGDDDYPTVLARSHGIRTPRGVTLDPNYVSPLVRSDGLIQRLVPPGVFAGTIPNSNLYRPLPRTRLAAAAASGASNVVVKPKTARLFVVGDVLTVMAPMGVMVFSGTWANGNTVTLTIDDSLLNIDSPTMLYTVVNWSNLTGLAQAFAQALNADSRFRRYQAIADGPRVTVLAKDMRTKAMLAVDKTGSGTVGIAGTQLLRETLVGTVVAVEPMTDTLTLAAATTQAFGSGIPIGVASSDPSELGMLSPQLPLDLTYRDTLYFACFTGAVVIPERMPYWDGELARLFPEIQTERKVGVG